MLFPTPFSGQTGQFQIGWVNCKMGEKFISDLVEGIESTFTKFAGDTEVSGGVDKSEDEAVSWIELDKLEEWANKNI